jgi:cell division protein FtsW
LVIILALLGIGIVAVYSSSVMAAHATYGDSARFLKHHVVAIGMGLLCGLGCLSVPYQVLRRSGHWLLLVAIGLLALVLVLGPEVGGAHRWFRIGRWSLQPSEFAQLALILYLADRLARTAPVLQDFWRGLLPPLMTTGLVAGMVLVQPDLGTASALGAVSLLLLAVARARWQHLVGVVVVAAVVLVWLVAAEEYRRQRILAFLNPWKDPRGSGYQILQSFFALASGGLLGVGVGGSLQKLFYLPNAHTDFIFAIIGEELGLVGTTAVIGLFALFLACGFRMAMAAHDLFSKYLVCGFVGMLGLEAMIHIAVVTGLMPTKGLPLPFVSYGGTSMVMNLVACGLIFNASRGSTLLTTVLSPSTTAQDSALSDVEGLSKRSESKDQHAAAHSIERGAGR